MNRSPDNRTVKLMRTANAGLALSQTTNERQRSRFDEEALPSGRLSPRHVRYFLPPRAHRKKNSVCPDARSAQLPADAAERRLLHGSRKCARMMEEVAIQRLCSRCGLYWRGRMPIRHEAAASRTPAASPYRETTRSVERNNHERRIAVARVDEENTKQGPSKPSKGRKRTSPARSAWADCWADWAD